MFTDLFSPSRRHAAIALLSVLMIALHLLARFVINTADTFAGFFVYDLFLFATLVLGGFPLLTELLRKTLRREFGSDLLAGISIVTSVLLGEYLAGSIVVLMLSGGEALEA